MKGKKGREGRKGKEGKGGKEGEGREGRERLNHPTSNASKRSSNYTYRAWVETQLHDWHCAEHWVPGQGREEEAKTNEWKRKKQP